MWLRNWIVWWWSDQSPNWDRNKPNFNQTNSVKQRAITTTTASWITWMRWPGRKSKLWMAIDNASFRPGLKAGRAQIRMLKETVKSPWTRCSLKTIGISLKGLSGVTQCQLAGTAPLEPKLVAQEASMEWTCKNSLRPMDRNEADNARCRCNK